MAETAQLWKDIDLSNPKSLARVISRVENSVQGYRKWLASLHPSKNVPVIGITGPPGAGKSTLVNGLISYYSAQKLKIGVIAVDPTSPFNMGSLLGDRIRMSEHYNNPDVFIRSLATRGSIGGLSSKTIEITDVMKAAGFDYIIIETVGVGQSEIEIAGIADTTVLVMIPEGGDDIQNMKSGIMEIGDIFVVNKADRPGSELFKANLIKMLHQKPASEWQVPVIATVGTEKKGVEELARSIEAHNQSQQINTRKPYLLAEKAFHLIQSERMKDIDKKQIAEDIRKKLEEGDFNLYAYVEGIACKDIL
jgi:LAO/AO transport system kinase